MADDAPDGCGCGCAVAIFLIGASIGAAIAWRLFKWISGVEL